MCVEGEHSERSVPAFLVWFTRRLTSYTEVQIMRGINHPAIVKLQAFFESPEHYFLVLERKCPMTSSDVPTISLTTSITLRSDGGWRTVPPDSQANRRILTCGTRSPNLSARTYDWQRDATPRLHRLHVLIVYNQPTYGLNVRKLFKFSFCSRY